MGALNGTGRAEKEAYIAHNEAVMAVANWLADLGAELAGLHTYCSWEPN